MGQKENTKRNLIEDIVERPKGFTVGEKHFFLYPMTLGKMLLVGNVYESLSVNAENFKLNAYAEALRLARESKDNCALFIAYHSLNSKDDVLNSQLLIERKEYFAKELDEESLASLLLICLSWNRTEEYVKYLALDKESERMKRVMNVKNDKNTYSFGGKSIYGSLISNACEKFGWTYDYVVWGISYVNLQLLLKDTVRTVYLSDDEAKRCHVPKEGTMLDGNNPTLVREYINSIDWR